MSFIDKHWVAASQTCFTASPAQKVVASLVENNTSDIESYAAVLTKIISRVRSTSVVPLTCSVIPAKTSSGKIPVMLSKYVGAKDTVKIGDVKILTVPITTGVTVGSVISTSDSMGTVLHVEPHKILVDVTTGTFVAADQFGTQTDVVAEAVGTGTGVQTQFTLAHVPVFPLTDVVYVAGVAKVRDVDYTIVNSTGVITFTVAPGIGAAVTADYTYVAYISTVTEVLTNIVGINTLLTNYTGPYSTSNGEGLTSAVAKEFKIQASMVPYTAQTRKAFTGMTMEFIQDIKASYGQEGLDKVVDIITNAIDQEIEQEYFTFLQTIATQKPDLVLNISYGTQSALGTGGVYEDIMSSILHSIGMIATSTNLSSGYFVVGSSAVCAAIQQITKVYQRPEFQSLNSNYVGHLLNSDIVLVCDNYSYNDYMIVGCSGPKEFDNSGVLFVPYSIDFVEAMDPDTFETVLGVINRYNFVRSPLDSKTANGSSDFFHVQAISFAGLTNYS